MVKITLVDHGIGNILSVQRAFEYCGAQVMISDNPQYIKNADYLVLPGVGAFADGMRGLSERGLVEAIIDFASKERPFLGICLGMQMMMEKSEEFGLHEGLGLIPGRVVRIPDQDVHGFRQKIPHIGWNSLELPREKENWNGTILEDIEIGETVYFVHSFTAAPENLANRLADTYYNGQLISASVQSGSLYGCQFHPEKSGVTGLKIINNFIKQKVEP
ncbi:imidazole glycerol phosphate synthase subunit HisH [Desulfosporosinus sp. BICA1-9]|uniref:imidazole glycerol phosphate synthase subunit HisH n=1 Tax=Desulfosporosinus sp. BICA1-9 TaxID=1531958 RepID=UPI00054C3A18|nr:imidazole glycerol phosphate synthase subunit HisH [Desulfosporosinus sp. BICA1-9]KJS89851.1 MAG: imidazole glycerol phosphate synthase [Desulfosporosinus sp. BICA1-9]HBW34974.1 imidazole glycerol phosphate synthase subunit HisH [Desulfosporosinus sp.]